MKIRILTMLFMLILLPLASAQEFNSTDYIVVDNIADSYDQFKKSDQNKESIYLSLSFS